MLPINNKTDNSNYHSRFSFSDAVPCLANLELVSKQFFIGDDKLTLSVYKYLEFSDLISLKNCCRSISKKIDSKYLKKFVRLGGITAKTRRDFWIKNINYKYTEELILKEFNFIENKEKEKNLYNS
jgi:hypothetical protein